MSHLKTGIWILGGVGAYLILKSSANNPTSPLNKLAKSLGVAPGASLLPSNLLAQHPQTTNLATRNGTAVAPQSANTTAGVITAAGQTAGFFSNLISALSRGGGSTTNAGKSSTSAPGGGAMGGSGGSGNAVGTGNAPAPSGMTPAQIAAASSTYDPCAVDDSGALIDPGGCAAATGTDTGMVYDANTNTTYVPGSANDPYAGQDVTAPNDPTATDAGATDPLQAAPLPDESSTSSTPDATVGLIDPTTSGALDTMAGDSGL